MIEIMAETIGLVETAILSYSTMTMEILAWDFVIVGLILLAIAV